MHKHKLIWQLYSKFVLVLFCLFFLIVFVLITSLKELYQENTMEDLSDKANLVESVILESAFPYSQELNHKINLLCQELGQKGNIHITFILPTGKVIGDSKQNTFNFNHYISDTEMKVALSGERLKSFANNPKDPDEKSYLVLPLKQNGKVMGILRVAAVSDVFANYASPLYLKIYVLFAGTLLLSFLLCMRLTQKIKIDLENIKHGAARFSQGQFHPPLNLPQIKEIAQVTQSMNQMAFSLDNYVENLLRQKSREEIILSSMTEGVIVIDITKRILTINNSAAHLLRISGKNIKGRRIEEIVLAHRLMEFINKAALANTFLEEEIIIYEKSEHYIHVQANPLKDTKGQAFGFIIVIRDITQLRRLENVRKEFAANVSHELKTPLTSIKGFVDTLMGGTIQLPEDAKRFLAIVAKQTDRIIAIVEDLMSLARLERYEEQGELLLEQAPILGILQSAIKSCEESALQKGIQIKLQCESHICGNVNVNLLEEAIINLLDNAIKYSGQQQHIAVACLNQEQELLISVADNGVGISAEHLPRLFERFYRVDKARSSNLGGTGLGLAIVKHIAQVHGGTVSVQSQPGKGSTFIIHLPAISYNANNP